MKTTSCDVVKLLVRQPGDAGAVAAMKTTSCDVVKYIAIETVHAKLGPQ